MPRIALLVALLVVVPLAAPAASTGPYGARDLAILEPFLADVEDAVFTAWPSAFAGAALRTLGPETGLRTTVRAYDGMVGVPDSASVDDARGTLWFVGFDKGVPGVFGVGTSTGSFEAAVVPVDAPLGFVPLTLRLEADRHTGRVFGVAAAVDGAVVVEVVLDPFHPLGGSFATVVHVRGAVPLGPRAYDADAGELAFLAQQDGVVRLFRVSTAGYVADVHDAPPLVALESAHGEYVGVTATTPPSIVALDATTGAWSVRGALDEAVTVRPAGDAFDRDASWLYVVGMDARSESKLFAFEVDGDLRAALDHVPGTLFDVDGTAVAHAPGPSSAAHLQDDAGTGADASDDRAAPTWLDRGNAYTGLLVRGVDDRDAYAFGVQSLATSTSSEAEVHVRPDVTLDVVLTMVRPDGTTVVVDRGGAGEDESLSVTIEGLHKLGIEVKDVPHPPPPNLGEPPPEDATNYVLELCEPHCELAS